MNGSNRFATDFRALTYMHVTSSVNTFKNMFKNPLTALSTLAKLLFYCWFLFMPLIVGLLRSNNDKSPLLDITKYIPLIGGIAFLLLSFYILYTLKKAADKYNPTMFKAPDVNLVFTSPLSRRTIYFFSILRSLAPHLISVLVLVSVAYSVTMMLHLKLEFYNIPLVVLGLLAFGLFIQTFRFMIYSLTKKYKAERLASILIYGYLAVVVLIVFRITLQNSGNVAAILPALGAPALEWLPFIGWAKGILVGLFSSGGNLLPLTLIYAACAAAALLLSVFWAVDYYEETAEYVDKVGNIQAAMQKGQIEDLEAIDNNKKKKKTAVSDLQIEGRGERVFFWKELLLYKEKVIGSPVNNLTPPLLLLAVGIIFTVAGRAMQVEDIRVFLILIIFLISIVMTSVSNAIGYEMKHAYLFLLPGNVRRKLFYISLFSYIRSAVYFLLLLIPLLLGGRLDFGNFLSIYLLAVTACAINISGKIIYTILFPDVTNKNVVVNFLKGIFIYAYYLPGAIMLGLAALIAFLLRMRLSFTPGCLAFAAGSAGAVLIIYLISGAIFRRLEYKE